MLVLLRRCYVVSPAATWFYSGTHNVPKAQEMVLSSPGRRKDTTKMINLKEMYSMVLVFRPVPLVSVLNTFSNHAENICPGFHQILPVTLILEDFQSLKDF